MATKRNRTPLEEFSAASMHRTIRLIAHTRAGYMGKIFRKMRDVIRIQRLCEELAHRPNIWDLEICVIPPTDDVRLLLIIEVYCSLGF